MTSTTDNRRRALAASEGSAVAGAEPPLPMMYPNREWTERYERWHHAYTRRQGGPLGCAALATPPSDAGRGEVLREWTGETNTLRSIRDRVAEAIGNGTVGDLEVDVADWRALNDALTAGCGDRGLVEALEATKEAAKAAHEFVARVTDRKGVDGWTLQGSIYEGFTTEIWADGAEPGKRTIAIVRDYQDALKIMAALQRHRSEAGGEG